MFEMRTFCVSTFISAKALPTEGDENEIMITGTKMKGSLKRATNLKQVVIWKRCLT